MPAPHALYSKMLAERTASRNVLVLFYLFYLFFFALHLSGGFWQAQPRSWKQTKSSLNFGRFDTRQAPKLDFVWAFSLELSSRGKTKSSRKAAPAKNLAGFRRGSPYPPSQVGVHFRVSFFGVEHGIAHHTNKFVVPVYPHAFDNGIEAG
jgi:hypothetical protein